jgi:hypothetical protein
MLVNLAAVVRHKGKNDGNYQLSAGRYSDYNFPDYAGSKTVFGRW